MRIFGRLFWSSQNLCSVPSNSVYGPPKIIVLSPQITFMVPQKSLFCPLLITNHCSPPKSLLCPSNSAYPASNSVYSPPKILLCPLLITNQWSPPKNYCFVPSKALFCPLKSLYGYFKIIVLSPKIPFMGLLYIDLRTFVVGPICRELRAFGGTNQTINLRKGDRN